MHQLEIICMLLEHQKYCNYCNGINFFFFLRDFSVFSNIFRYVFLFTLQTLCKTCGRTKAKRTLKEAINQLKTMNSI